jgi:sporulation protein YlmC with PRC-barrel domain
VGESEYIRLALRLLDEQIVDAEGRRCGRVEDLELDAGAGDTAWVVGMLCGATAWKRRLPPRFSELFPGDPRGLRRVTYEAIESIENEIHLRSSEGELSQAADTEAAPMAVSQLIGSTVVASDGTGVGRVCDVVASRPRGSDQLWQLWGLLIGWRGLLQRAGFQPRIDDDLREGRRPANLLAWERITRLDDQGRLVLRD